MVPQNNDELYILYMYHTQMHVTLHRCVEKGDSHFQYNPFLDLTCLFLCFYFLNDQYLIFTTYFKGISSFNTKQDKQKIKLIEDQWACSSSSCQFGELNIVMVLLIEFSVVFKLVSCHDLHLSSGLFSTCTYRLHWECTCECI